MCLFGPTDQFILPYPDIGILAKHKTALKAFVRLLPAEVMSQQSYKTPIGADDKHLTPYLRTDLPLAGS
jgi:hypothetical protein